jgi:hypothetical protein
LHKQFIIANKNKILIKEKNAFKNLKQSANCVNNFYIKVVSTLKENGLLLKGLRDAELLSIK